MGTHTQSACKWLKINGLLIPSTCNEKSSKVPRLTRSPETAKRKREEEENNFAIVNRQWNSLTSQSIFFHFHRFWFIPTRKLLQLMSLMISHLEWTEEYHLIYCQILSYYENMKTNLFPMFMYKYKSNIPHYEYIFLWLNFETIFISS